METKQAKLFTKEFILLFIICIFGMLGFQMLIPSMPKFAATFNAGDWAGGMMSASVSFAAFACRPFAGMMADTMRRKMLLIVSMLGAGLSFYLYSIAPSISFVLAVRVFHGLFFGLNTTVTMTMAANVIPEEKMGSGMGIFGLANVLCMGIAPSLGIFFMDKFGFDTLFYAAIGTSIIGIILTLVISDQPIIKKVKAAKKSAGEFFSQFFAKQAVLPAGIAMFSMCASGVVTTFIAILGEENGISNVGIFFTINAGVLVLIRPLMGKITDRYPVKYLVYPCSTVVISGLILLGLSRSTMSVAIAGALYGTGFGGMMPALQSLCIKLTPSSRRGAASGTYYMGMDVGNIVGPIVGGALGAAFGFGNALMLMSISVAMGMVLMFISTIAEKKKTKK